eukprot:3930405-Lingulodinium_polyedra.AAC.1
MVFPEVVEQGGWPAHHLEGLDVGSGLEEERRKDDVPAEAGQRVARAHSGGCAGHLGVVCHGEEGERVCLADEGPEVGIGPVRGQHVRLPQQLQQGRCEELKWEPVSQLVGVRALGAQD